MQSLDNYSRPSGYQRQKVVEALHCRPTDSKTTYSAQPQGGQHEDARAELSELACQEEVVTTVSYGGLLLNGQGAVFNNYTLNIGAAGFSSKKMMFVEIEKINHRCWYAFLLFFSIYFGFLSFQHLLQYLSWLGLLGQCS